ncbi:probable GTP-binding protein OBGM, mitochondrial [Phalaenopsis equestris]|uniref:probable GTP-binding protein OBGM, mitochondrial n=1 Tax=Phalaenopsis equestris TaxID=78828 RepID=UPI0009E5F154|nr:probable GTP-binding protein OBGM, mitochondrial [Phalaenopsis equestris]XP_020575140.1 probable GTP-binding protein OBGM, mitochondrial [Phalaenopsis equestris]
MWWRRGVLAHAHGALRPKNEPFWLFTALSYSDSPAKKKGKATPLQERRMVDRFRVWAKGGEGGNGCWSYRRSRTDRHGTPDGGNGGRGGDVYLECSATLWDFSNLQHHLNAKKGGNGISKNMIGTRGSDKVAHVPVGTVVHLVSGTLPTLVSNNSITSMDPWEIPVTYEDPLSPAETNKQRFNKLKPSPLLKKVEDEHCNNCSYEKVSEELEKDQWWKDADNDDDEWWKADNKAEEAEEWHFEFDESVQYSVAELTQPGQRILVARGGEGGLGNAALNKDVKHHRRLMKLNASSSTQTLDDEELFSLISGALGSDSVLILELKSIADVGLVGMPNAGKSTLLGAISRANPAVGDYAFTTLRPNIGRLNYDDFFSISVADIPGLVRGAHEDRGLGHAFLRHIERTKALAYVVDLAVEGTKGVMPWEQLRDLVLELENHKVGLSRRPSIIVANKIDEKGAEEVYEELKIRVHGVSILPVCAVLGEGVEELKVGLRKLMKGSESRYLELSNITLD